MASYKLTYFDINGRAEYIRLAFVAGGIEFDNELINRDMWQAMKPTTPFGQLPLLTYTKAEGEEPVKIAQSNAILRFVGKAIGLYPEDPVAAMHVDSAMDYMEDIMAPMQATIFPPRYAMPAWDGEDARMAARARLANDILPSKFAAAEALMAANGSGWVVGDAMTIADLKWYTHLNRFTSGDLDGVPATILDDYPNLKGLLAKVEAVPAIAEWQAAEQARKAAKNT
uniref:Glutathione S-transferase n=1 Tax=Phaeomonas parva TaxID=124430 RepID=A0A6U4DPQ7_9STRA|eukprot:CAMPEP_0118882874 /NCGR_PEP_ID=MMETSP1163-20130328/22037_1 /TAXON_ID=124430 /ORGANISM="Phaeomonas parva, Strain CCMP2877" /LENGTH=226 /DNA_ID=CAMNT_0006820085 /DNA_START=229 /DNA_END=909 /DNA_ORIENTATION=+